MKKIKIYHVSFVNSNGVDWFKLYGKRNDAVAVYDALHFLSDTLGISNVRLRTYDVEVDL